MAKRTLIDYEAGAYTLGLFLMRTASLRLKEYQVSDALSKELDPRCSNDDDQIESSTDVARVKSGATVDDTNCVMVSDELGKDFLMSCSTLVRY